MILTSVDLPAPFSPSSARTEPPAAVRSTPCRTSTPPNDLRIPRASRRKPLLKLLAVLGLVVLREIEAVDDDVRDGELRRDRLALDEPDQVRDADLSVPLREVSRVGDPLLVRLDQAPR